MRIRLSALLGASVLIAVAGVVLVGGRLGWFVDRPIAVVRYGKASGPARIGGPFGLVDQRGRRRSDRDFRGKRMLVFFGYTHCPDFCPTGLQTMTQALRLLGADAAKLQPIFVTVDPERDTVKVLRSYAANFHPSLIALTGTTAEVAAAARAYRVYYAKGKIDSDGDYTMAHSTYTYLMGPDGRYITHFRHGISPKALAAGLKKHL